MKRIASALALLALAVHGVSGSPSEPGGNELDLKLRELLQHVRIVEIDDGSGNPLKTIRFEGVNVQVVNGVGTTASMNGLGNLLVGYAEPASATSRTGSHNLILGERNAYSSFGGIVTGTSNVLDGEHSAAIGTWGTAIEGSRNVALSSFGGRVTGSFNALVSADTSDVESSVFSTVTGSWLSQVEAAQYSHVLGGQAHRIHASNEATITGGEGHVIDSAGVTSLVGGSANRAQRATVGVLVGGRQNTLGVSGAPLYPVVVGGAENLVDANDHGTVIGGQRNTVSGDFAVVGGGLGRSATGRHDWVAGSLFEEN